MAQTRSASPALLPPSRLEIVNELALILARADVLRASGREPEGALEQALEEYEVTSLEIEERSRVAVCGAARKAWASLVHQCDALLVAWILTYARDIQEEDQEGYDAIEQAIAKCHETWIEATRLRVEETHQVARSAWAVANAGDLGSPVGLRLGAQAVVQAIDGILERALALHESGRSPGDAITRALDECRASPALASVAAATWVITMHGSEASS